MMFGQRLLDVGDFLFASSAVVNLASTARAPASLPFNIR